MEPYKFKTGDLVERINEEHPVAKHAKYKIGFQWILDGDCTNDTILFMKDGSRHNVNNLKLIKRAEDINSVALDEKVIISEYLIEFINRLMIR